MEMDSVILGQQIAQRRKPVRIIHTPTDTIFSPQNKGFRRVKKPAIAARQSANGSPKAGFTGAFSGLRPSLSPATGIARAASSLSLAFNAFRRQASKSGESRKPQLIALACAVAGMLLLAASAALLGNAAGNRVNLREFTMPGDSRVSELLLLSLAPVKADPEELPPELPLTLSTSLYRITKNDTLDAIARKFGVRMDTLISLNGISDVRRIQSGAMIKIPNIDGIVHAVAKGESIGSIAARYKVELMDLVDANNLSSQVIHPGQTLFIPGARLQSAQLKRALGTLIAWPIKGRISSYFGYRTSPFSGIRQFHNGLDIVAPENSSIHPTMDGKVAETGFSAIFGNFVIVSHYDGYQTLYGHMNKVLVKQGQAVTQSSVLGLLGSTGLSTGPHLHFGVFRKGMAQDPLKLLGK